MRPITYYRHEELRCYCICGAALSITDGVREDGDAGVAMTLLFDSQHSGPGHGRCDAAKASAARARTRERKRKQDLAEYRARREARILAGTVSRTDLSREYPG